MTSSSVKSGPYLPLTALASADMLTFCAGVGGSLLIIGSAAGVVAMGLEKINFGWYFRKISLLALAGYVAGIAVIWLEHMLIGL